jgi:hypothetical protein
MVISQSIHQGFHYLSITTGPTPVNMNPSHDAPNASLSMRGLLLVVVLTLLSCAMVQSKASLKNCEKDGKASPNVCASSSEVGQLASMCLLRISYDIGQAMINSPLYRSFLR